jgi:hypothetical protein
MSATATDTDTLAAIKAWLLVRTPDVGDIDLDFDIVENRVIDSLSFMEFVFFLEKVSGRDVELKAQSVNSFRTLRSIRDNVLKGREYDERPSL